MQASHEVKRADRAFCIGPLQTLFGFVPLSWPLLGALAAVTVAYLATAEAAKHFALRGF